jgi:hypothetical protein
MIAKPVGAICTAFLLAETGGSTGGTGTAQNSTLS